MRADVPAPATIYKAGLTPRIGLLAWHLRQWVAQGVLLALPAPSRQQASYTKPELAGLMDLTHSLSFDLDNENEI